MVTMSRYKKIGLILKRASMQEVLNSINGDARYKLISKYDELVTEEAVNKLYDRLVGGSSDVDKEDKGDSEQKTAIEGNEV